MLFLLLEPLELRGQSQMHSYRVYNVCGDDSRLNLYAKLAFGGQLAHFRGRYREREDDQSTLLNLKMCQKASESGFEVGAVFRCSRE